MRLGRSSSATRTVVGTTGGGARRKSRWFRVLAWIPFAVSVLGVLIVLWAVASVPDIVGPQFPPVTNEPLAFYTPVDFPPHAPDMGGAAVRQADVGIQIRSIDVATRTVSVRLGVRLDHSVARRLQIFVPSRKVWAPLTAVPRGTWSNLPVEIRVELCGREDPAVPNTGCLPDATILLGQLLGPSRVDARETGVSVPLELPISASPSRFPSDRYELVAFPAVVLPDEVRIGNSSVQALDTDNTVHVAISAGFDDRSLTASENKQSEVRQITVLISRPTRVRVVVYLMAILPLLLGLSVSHLWYRNRRAARPGFDLGAVAGLAAAL